MDGQIFTLGLAAPKSTGAKPILAKTKRKAVGLKRART
jgi:hypothetical protein